MYIYNRRKFRSETSDNMDSWKAEVRRVRRDKIRRKKMQMREKVGKSRFTVFFQCFGAPEGRKVGSLKRQVRSQLARWEMKNCTPLWREAHFEVKMHKTHQLRTTFGSWDVEKVHAVVARSTFGSQNVQNTPASDHFWKLRCRKKCTPLWREAHLEVKMYKTHHCRTTFGSWDVEKVHAVVARSTFGSQNVQNTPLLDHFWKFRCGKKCTPLWREAHLEVKMYKNTPLLDHFWKFRCRKKCTPLWREAHLEVKMYKTHHARTTFGSWDVEKVHAVVARSTFGSQNVQNTPLLGPLLEVQMSNKCRKKCTPLWREAHFEVKSVKKLWVLSLFLTWRCRKT